MFLYMFADASAALATRQLTPGLAQYTYPPSS